jgi:hypothetical protein
MKMGKYLSVLLILLMVTAVNIASHTGLTAELGITTPILGNPSDLTLSASYAGLEARVGYQFFILPLVAPHLSLSLTAPGAVTSDGLEALSGSFRLAFRMGGEKWGAHLFVQQMFNAPNIDGHTTADFRPAVGFDLQYRRLRIESVTVLATEDFLIGWNQENIDADPSGLGYYQLGISYRIIGPKYISMYQQARR